jgi:hypothetical protein
MALFEKGTSGNPVGRPKGILTGRAKALYALDQVVAKEENLALLPLVEGFKITAQTKRELVQGLMVAVEQRRVMWSAAWEILTAEMRRYEYDIGPTGQVSYAAPSGYHDDCVMALALAVWGCRTYGAEPGRMVRLAGGGRRPEGGGRRAVTLA